MKKLLNIYNAFKTINSEREKESLNDIIKGTKTVLANKLKFNKYLKNYSKTTERYTFKSPGITDYPVFKKSSNILIPVKRKKINFYEDLDNNEKNDDSPIKLKKLLIISPQNSLYKSKILNNINTLEESKKMLRNKLFKLGLNNTINKKERYNSLFLDFFHKWNSHSIYNENSKLINFSSSNMDCGKNINNNIEYIKNDNYSELKYDDNKIFNEDYTDFINDKIEYIKNNKIENNQEKIESSFNDSNGKEIYLKLESAKIFFKPINAKKNIIQNYNDMANKNINGNETKIINVPLYYAFLICYKNFKLFKHLLISSIVFSNNFETVTLNDNLIGLSLKELNQDDNPEIKFDSSKNIKGSFINPSPKKCIGFRKLVTKNYTNFGNGTPKGENKQQQSGTPSFSMLRNSFLEKLNNNNNPKKEEIIHSNTHRNRNTLYNIYCSSEKNEKNKRLNNDKNNHIINNNHKSNNYNEYVFLWETPAKTFLVTVQMPMIHFKYKNLKSEILAYCDKSLFLYIYKKNFINWDFYILNFLFSIKLFRKIILNNYSLNKKYIFPDMASKIINQDSNNKLNNVFSFRNKIKLNNLNNERYNNQNKSYELLNESIIINKNNNKIYNLLNENNETYLFFYTNNLYQNSIIKLYSYLIIIDYEKLNPKLKWKYYLDFKQMKQLNEITKYETLDTFLPKIIKTDFQNGFLSMDFSLFKEFDIEILGYEKKNLINENVPKNKNKTPGSTTNVNNIQNNKELSIDIHFPYIIVQKATHKNNNLHFKTDQIDLKIDFLQNINNYGIDSWSKKLLEILNNENDYLTGNSNLASEIMSKKTLTKKNNPLSYSYSGKKLFKKCISFNSIPITNKFYYEEK